MATIGEAARHLFMSPPNFLRLVDGGVIERAERGSYDLEDVRERYIRHIREQAAGRSIKGDLDPLQERARKDKELADKTALQNRVTRGELFSGAAVSKLVHDAFSKIRTRLFALPTKLAPVVLHLETIPEVQAKLMDGINDALAELSEQAVLKAAGAASANVVSNGGGEVLEDDFSPAPSRQAIGQGCARQGDVTRRAVAEPRED